MLAPVLLLEFFAIAPRMVPEFNPPMPPELLGYARPLFKPEPLEHVQYMLAIFSLPIIFFIWLKSNINQLIDDVIARMTSVLPTLLELTGQIILITVLGVATALYNPWFALPSRLPDLIALAILILLGVSLVFYRQKLSSLFAKDFSVICTLAAFIFTFIQLTPDVFTETSLRHCQISTAVHLPFTFDEFDAVLSGKTLLVNFFPTYQIVSEYCLEPIFRVIGLNALTYTTIMSFLSFCGLMVIYIVFWRITRNALSALLLYLPFLCLSFYQAVPAPVEIGTIFNYYALGPIRLVGPWLAMGFVAWYWMQPTNRRAMITFAFTTFVAVNNLDFGIPILGAIYLALTLIDTEGGFANWNRLLTQTRNAIVGGVISLAIFVAWTLLRSSSLPHLESMFDFQKLYMNGFYAIPLPCVGFYYFLFVTWMTAIFMALLRALTKSSNEPLLTSFLLLTGVYGCGTFVYYLGRSAWTNLPGSFPAWGMTIMLLIWAYVVPVFKEWTTLDTKTKVVNVAPVFLCSVLYCLCWSQIIYTPNLLAQWQRISSPAEGLDVFPHCLVPQLKKVLDRNEDVMMICSYGDWLAKQVDAKNYYPYVTCENTLISMRQVDLIMQLVRSHHINKIFGSLPIEMNDILKAEGFEKIDSLKTDGQRFAYFDAGKPFDFWRRRIAN